MPKPIVRRQRVTVYRGPLSGRFLPRGAIEFRELRQATARKETFLRGRPTVRPFRHPLSGRFISEEHFETLKKARVTKTDVERILKVSPRMVKALARAREEKRLRRVKTILRQRIPVALRRAQRARRAAG